MTQKCDSSESTHFLGMPVNGMNQGVHRLGRCELADAMSQIENVSGSCGVGVHVGRAKTLEYSNGLAFNFCLWRKKHIGIQVALQGFACTTH